jgi:CelD/BcsL family acetyltransferase involved in cellulose biosynthesis/peptidoglycan/xylan/chitin deacetylase (PgdA/CDA1 family)
MASSAHGEICMKVLLHESWEEVQNLSDRWNSLLVQSASNTIFLTWEWIHAWWKNYASSQRPFVLTAWEGDSLEGIAPFFLEDVSHWGIKWACLKLIGDGSGDSEYLDFISRRGREKEVVASFVQFLESQRNRWDYLVLHGTPENSPCLDSMLNIAQEKSWRFSTELIPCATLLLPRNWNDYLRLLKPRFRTKMRSTLGYFDEKIGLPYSCATEQALNLALPALFDLHTRRWQTKNLPGVFGQVAKRNFYRDLSHAMQRQGWLAFHRLDWGARPLAMQYGFIYGNRFSLLQEGYDPDFAELRPGMALRAGLMRHWIETGLTEYDFLAGTAPYKFEWGAERRQSVKFTLAPSRRAAWISFGETQAFEKSKDAVRSILPENLLAWRRQQNSRAIPASPTNGHKSPLSQRLAAALYGRTPLGAAGRAVASRYELGPRRGQLHRRSIPVCHIFIYHRVNNDYDPFLPALPVAAFRKQIEFLKKNFPILNLNDLANGSFAETREKYNIAITFDDGYRDNFLYAYPTLKDLAVPATIYLATGCLESGEHPWYDQISWGFKLTNQPTISLAHLGGPEGLLAPRSEKLKTMNKTLGWLRTITEEDRLSCIPKVFEALHVPPKLAVPNPMLSWDEVRQMNKQNISFGAHTVSHPVLSKLSDTKLEAEITGSKNKIEEKLNTPVQHFAYPFGQPSDVGSGVKEAVRRAGFATAVTTVWGFNRPGDDLYDLKRFSPRFNPWDFNPGRFAMMLDWYRLAGVQRNEEQSS